MAFQFSSFLRSLTRERRFAALTRFEEHAFSLFSPSDWIVVGLLGILMAGGAFATLMSVSSALSIEVPMRGGTHIEAVVGSPRFINPLLAISDTDQDLTALIYAGLMRENAGSLVPDLAERYEISDDGTVYTFYISPKAKFHDGTRVTADDVVFTIKLTQNPDVKSPARASWDGVEAEKRDDHIVTFTLPSPYAPFLANTTLGILPAHLWEGIQLEELPFSNLNIEPVGAGPYKINKVFRDQSGIPTEVRLIASKHAIKIPYITNFIFRFYPDQGAVRDALSLRAADAAYGITPDSSKMLFYEAVYARIFAVFMNQSQNAIFADPVVRRALDTALDKNSLVSIIVGGYGTPLTGPLPPQGGKREATTHDHLSDARAILEKDGWVMATSSAVFTKKIKKTVTPLSFTLTTAHVPELKAAAEAVAETWRTLGAEVKLEFFEQGDLVTEVLRPRKYDALLFGEVIGREPDLYAFWHSSQRNDPGLNIALYTNSTVDKLLEAARTEIDSDVRNTKTEEAAHIISAETAAIFLYAPHFTYATEPTLRGVALSEVATPSDRLVNVSDWFLKTERVWPIFVSQY